MRSKIYGRYMTKRRVNIEVETEKETQGLNSHIVEGVEEVIRRVCIT